MEGRYYGGGVLELVPSEFKKLPLPYVNVTPTEFSRYREAFEKKDSIETILKINDFKILNKILNLGSSEIQKISLIREKLLNKRLRKRQIY